MKTFVINLDRRADRMNAVDLQMRRLGLQYERFSAIDGLNDQEQVAPANTLRFTVTQKKSPVRGELACAMSHIKVWQTFLDSDHEYALILEDDIQIGDEVPGVLKQFKSAPCFDFFNLSSATPYRVNDDDIRFILDCRIRRRSQAKNKEQRRRWKSMEWRRRWKIYQLIEFSNGLVACECDPAPALGSGYIISRRAAESFLEAATHLDFPIDLTWRHSGGRLIQGFMNRPIVRQTGLDTDIAGRFNQQRLSIPLRLLRPFYKNRRIRRRFDVFWMYTLGRRWTCDPT